MTGVVGVLRKVALAIPEPFYILASAIVAIWLYLGIGFGYAVHLDTNFRTNCPSSRAPNFMMVGIAWPVAIIGRVVYDIIDGRLGECPKS